MTQHTRDQAKANLAKIGMTLSDYVRQALVKAANNEIQAVNSVSQPEVVTTHHETNDTIQVTDPQVLKALLDQLAKEDQPATLTITVTKSHQHPQ